MRSRHDWALLLLLSITACGTQPSTQNLDKELRTVISWAATAQMVSQAWLQNRAPAVYVRQTLHKTQENLQTEFDTITKVAPPQKRAIALDRVKHLKHTVQQMETDLDRQERTTLTENLLVLFRQKQAIQALMHASGEQP